MANEYRVSQYAIEVLDDSSGSARVSQFAIEVLNPGVAGARVSQFAIEVLREVAGTTSARRRQIVN